MLAICPRLFIALASTLSVSAVNVTLLGAEQGEQKCGWDSPCVAVDVAVTFKASPDQPAWTADEDTTLCGLVSEPKPETQPADPFDIDANQPTGAILVAKQTAKDGQRVNPFGGEDVYVGLFV